MPESNGSDGAVPLRAMWSGVITFGLVSIPVDLHTMTRPLPFRLRMLGPDGTPLSRRYYCPEHEAYVGNDEIVRGHEEDDESFVIVEEEELDALEPTRSREIDLERFVPVDQISLMHIQRSYLLLPARGSTKAYRLLSQTMDKSGRAGIARFVMRGHAYLIAITSEGGALRGHTLRYVDELRSAEDVGLPKPPDQVDHKKLRAFQNAIKAAAGSFDPLLLEDEYGAALLSLAEQKHERGEVVDAREAARATSQGEIVDLMQLLKERLMDAPAPRRGGRATARSSGAKSARRRPSRAALRNASKDELYQRAKKLDIAGRSRMSKEELVDALESA